MNDTTVRRPGLAATAVRLVGLWLVLGALFKLFLGNPSLLPAPIRDFMPGVSLILKYRLVIALELAVAILAFLQPRRAWPVLVAVYAVFLGVLVHMIATGQESCGCFGESIPVPPWLMLAIDGTLVGFMLWTRPWVHLAPAKWRWAVLVPAILLASPAPWIVISEAPTVDAARADDGSWKLPDKLPSFAILDPSQQEWVGKPVRDTELGIWMDTDLCNGDTTWILYRVTCDHCAEELRELHTNWDQQTIYVLVRLPEENEEESRVVDEALLPPHEEIILPEGVEYVCQTPVVLTLEGGVVVDAKQGDEVEGAE